MLEWTAAFRNEVEFPTIFYVFRLIIKCQKSVYNFFYLANMRTEASNFLFLKQHDMQLVRLGALAERYFHDDANTCLIKLRQLGELLAQLIAAKTGLLQNGEESQVDLLRRLRFERLLPSEVAVKSASSAIAPRMGPGARQGKPSTPSNMRDR